jgi:apolipoprotein N-acyltransferase
MGKYKWTLAGFAAALVSGGLLGLCYWPWEAYYLAWVALVPFLAVLPKLSMRGAWMLGTLFGAAFYAVTLRWLFGIAGPLSLMWMVVLGLFIGIACGFVRFAIQKWGEFALVWAAPLCLAGQEILRSESLPRLRFSYGVWGYSQAGSSWLAQIASIGGVYLLTFLIVAFNGALAYGLLRARSQRWIAAGILGAGIIALGLISQPHSYDNLPQLTAACVQAETMYLREYQDLAKKAANQEPRPAFIVLPEHAITDFTDEKHKLIRGLAKIADERDVYIVIGVHVRPEAGQECKFDNVAMCIGPDGKILSQQAKAVPIPFFIDGNPAKSLAVTQTDYGPVGMCVCYDDSFTDIPRTIAALGAQILLIPVMNPETWPVMQRWQQADIAMFRAIELRRCLVRGASSGISQIIDATGRTRCIRTQEEKAGFVTASVYMVGETTFFARIGYRVKDVFGWTFMGFACMMMAMEVRDHIRDRKKRKMNENP